MQTWSGGGALSNTKLSNLQRYQDIALELIESSKIKDVYNKSILKVNMTRKFLLMKNVNLSMLISNFDIKLFKTEPFSSYSLLKIKFLH